VWLSAPSGNLRAHRVRRKVDFAGPRNRAVINKRMLKKTARPTGRKYTGQSLLAQLHTPRSLAIKPTSWQTSKSSMLTVNPQHAVLQAHLV
jgi:hypothetical protein